MSIFLLLLSLSSAVPAFSKDLPPALDSIVSQVAAESQSGNLPVVISDLDETLIDSTTRRFFSLREAARDLCGEHRTGDCGRFFSLNLGDFLSLENRYDFSPAFDGVGMSPTGFSASLKSAGLSVYLSGRYLELDQPVPGSIEFIQALRSAGATVFYVSSRYRDVQFGGTLANLKDLGILETGNESQVYLRERGTSSIDFKKQSFEKIGAWTKSHHGKVLLVMENEPENMNAMTDTFPEGTGVFVDGAFLKSEPLRGNPLRIKNFREEKPNHATCLK